MFGHRLLGTPEVASSSGVLTRHEGSGAPVLEVVVKATPLKLLSARVRVGAHHHLLVQQPVKKETRINDKKWEVE